MGISSSHVGKTYRLPKGYLVSAAKIGEFATAIGDTNPKYFTDSAVAPPTFAVIIAAQAWQMLFDDAELELALSRTIHADQRFDIALSLKAGDLVDAVLEIEKVRNRNNVDMITVAVKLYCADDLVCTARSQLIHTRQEVTQ